MRIPTLVRRRKSSTLRVIPELPFPTRPATPTSPAETPMTVAPVSDSIAADTWLQRFRAILVGVLGVAVGGIGALAFFTSFEAIKSYAHGSGGIDPKHDFAIPLLVDSFIVVATGADLWFSTTGRKRLMWEVWWPKALLATAAGVSFTLNIAHAERGDWAAKGVAAIPPAALILGVELLMMVLRRATTMRTERLEAAYALPQAEMAEVDALASKHEVASSPPADTAPSSPPSPGSELVKSPPKPKSATPRRSRGTTTVRRSQRPAGQPTNADRIRTHVLAERAEGRNPSAGDVAGVLQVDKAQARRVIKALPVPNGRPLIAIEGGQQ